MDSGGKQMRGGGAGLGGEEEWETAVKMQNKSINILDLPFSNNYKY